MATRGGSSSSAREGGRGGYDLSTTGHSTTFIGDVDEKDYPEILGAACGHIRGSVDGEGARRNDDDVVDAREPSRGRAAFTSNGNGDDCTVESTGDDEGSDANTAPHAKGRPEILREDGPPMPPSQIDADFRTHKGGIEIIEDEEPTPNFHPPHHLQDEMDHWGRRKEEALQNAYLFLRYLLWVLTGFPPPSEEADSSSPDGEDNRPAATAPRPEAPSLQGESTMGTTQPEVPVLEATLVDEEVPEVNITYTYRPPSVYDAFPMNEGGGDGERKDDDIPCWKRYERSACVVRALLLSVLVVGLALGLTVNRQDVPVSEAEQIQENSRSPTNPAARPVAACVCSLARKGYDDNLFHLTGSHRCHDDDVLTYWQAQRASSFSMCVYLSGAAGVEGFDLKEVHFRHVESNISTNINLATSMGIHNSHLMLEDGSVSWTAKTMVLTPLPSLVEIFFAISTPASFDGTLEVTGEVFVNDGTDPGNGRMLEPQTRQLAKAELTAFLLLIDLIQTSTSKPSNCPSEMPSLQPTSSPAFPSLIPEPSASSSPSASPMVKNELTDAESAPCTNTAGYVDMYGDGCSYYESDPNYPLFCASYGGSGEVGNTPNENCCVCKEALEAQEATGIPNDVSSVSPARFPSSKPTGNPTNGPSNKPTPPSPTPALGQLVAEPTSESPSAISTQKPTVEPTDLPTKEPSSKPAVTPLDSSPTKRPSDQPTKDPTKPTNSPSARPTREPSSKPTNQPTKAPSSKPPAPSPTLLEGPTSKPTAFPSARPTREPSDGPTKAPSNKPTAPPTLNPTREPLDQPTNEPTSKPTLSPSARPTTKPSDQPTKLPPNVSPPTSQTQKPSDSPTSAPSKKPSDIPTRDPTPSPTRKPSNSPTLAPLKKPTDIPTQKPTNSPTPSPSKEPTDIPTQSPTPSPTKKPTLAPTKKPTADPTAKPTQKPTLKPTLSPTKKPTAIPTAKPTQKPTAKPTETPTPKPSILAFKFKSELQTALNACRTPLLQSDPACLNMKSKYGWPMSTWLVGELTDMSFLLVGKTDFNEDISSWDVSKVTDMRNMFLGCSAFNSPLNNWSVSNVKNFRFAFHDAPSFNQPLSLWDISSATDMASMFWKATSFNQDLCAWRDDYPYGQTGNLFGETGCLFTGDPQAFLKGPFCASSCL